MKDLFSSMLRLPLEMAQMGAEQLQQILDGNGSRPYRNGHSQTDEPQRTPEPGVDMFGSMMGAGQQILRGLADSMQQPGSSVDTDTFWPGDSYSHGYDDTGAATATDGWNDSGFRQSVEPYLSPQDFGRLDVSTMVVLGDSLAAGAGDFTLSSDTQRQSFAAQLASYFRVEFRQPLFEPPGLPLPFGCVDSVRLPDLGQTTVLEDLAATDFANLAIPGFGIRDCVRLRPCTPLIQADDAKRTLANMIVDFHRVIESSSKPRTQLEKAVDHCPTFVILAFGYDTLMQASLNDAALPDIAELQRDYAIVLRRFADSGCDVAVLNVPNPLHTAAFSSVESAARVLSLNSESLMEYFGLRHDDYVTVKGLLEIGAQIDRGRLQSLDASYWLSAADAEKISAYHASLNAMIHEEVARCDRVALCDIASTFRHLSEHPRQVGHKHLTSDYLGGCFGLSGFSLGQTFSTLIANEVISSINDHFNASIPQLDLRASIDADPIANCRVAVGRNWDDYELEAMRHRHPNELKPTDSPPSFSLNPPGRTSGESIDRRYNEIYREPPRKALELPPGLEQVLPLNRDASYHGDAMRVIHCRQSEHVPFGACTSNVFDGLAMFGGHLHGSLRFVFRPPIGNISHFEVTFEGPLTAEQGILSTPDFLRFPLKGPQVVQPPGTVCSGDVDLVTGEVSNLAFFLVFENSGLAALQRLNPTSFPSPPIIRFKQPIAPEEQGKIYGTAWARFHQREDGRLDFRFHGTAFVPMLPGFRFALPLGGPDGDFATVPADGTQLHPHIHLSTVETRRSGKTPTTAMIPTNTIREFTSDSSRTCFGDDFNLNHEELGFARGRSYLAGRIRIQFGERFGDSVPFSVSMLPPGGLTRKRNLSPLQDAFPGRLGQGMEGHDTVLRFPLLTYRQNDLFLIDDPFDFAIGAVNIYTGEVIGDFLHRALLGQALFFALVRVEPRTPQGSFEYRGPSLFERGPNGQLRYRFNGSVYLLYQEGFLFPRPDLANGVPIGPDSQLDPYFQIEAVEETKRRPGRKSGGGRMQLSTSGDRFSYQYSISNHATDKARFEYTNHSQNAQFCMRSLAWVSFTNSRRGGHDEYDTVTFSGFGEWSLDKKGRSHNASVQVTTIPGRPYVSILIDGGSVSNVNTRPSDETPPLTALDDRTTHDHEK